AGRLAGLDHVLHHRREELVRRKDLRHLAALADVLGYLLARVLDLHLVARRGHDLERPKDGHARADERRVGPAEARERDLVDQVAEYRGLDEEMVLCAPAPGRVDEPPEEPPCREAARG